MVKRIIYPPVWLLLGLISVFAFNEMYPVMRFTSLLFQIVGGVVIVVGLLLLVTANGLFVRAGTDVIPFRDVSALVTTGIYRYTRNPMYLGMAAVLLGLMHFMPAWGDGQMLERFMRLGVLVVAGVVVYFGMLLLQGFRLRDFNRKSLG